MSERAAGERLAPDDDGRTVADMSQVGRATRRGEALPEEGSRGGFADELQDDDERRAVMLGALKAGLSIGLVYIVAFGAAIALMVWLWT